MPLPPIKLVWSPRRQPADWRWGGLLGSYRRGGGGSWAVAVSVRGVLLWGGTLGLAALLATAGAATLWLDRKPSNRITYADLVLPWHWPQLNRLRGESQIEEGVADLREKKYGPALLSLEAGLRRFPASPGASASRDSSLGGRSCAFRRRCRYSTACCGRSSVSR